MRKTGTFAYLMRTLESLICNIKLIILLSGCVVSGFSLHVDSTFLPRCKRLSSLLSGGCSYIYFFARLQLRHSWINQVFVCLEQLLILRWGVNLNQAASRLPFSSNHWYTWLLWTILRTNSILVRSGVSHSKLFLLQIQSLIYNKIRLTKGVDSNMK